MTTRPEVDDRRRAQRQMAALPAIRDRRNRLVGQTFGRLTVLDRYCSVYWLCRCDCGAETIVLGWNLTSGNTRSCGHHRPVGKRHFMARRGSPEHRAKLSAAAKARQARAASAKLLRCAVEQPGSSPAS